MLKFKELPSNCLFAKCVKLPDSNYTQEEYIEFVKKCSYGFCDTIPDFFYGRIYVVYKIDKKGRFVVTNSRGKTNSYSSEYFEIINV